MRRYQNNYLLEMEEEIMVDAKINEIAAAQAVRTAMSQLNENSQDKRGMAS